ncbi:MAG: sugar phosphate nucleotidyltransferase [bacterium]
MRIKVLILAAGFGERLEKSVLEATNLTSAEQEALLLRLGMVMPKGLLPINGIPILTRLASQLKEVPGINISDDVFLVTNSHFHEEFFIWGQNFGLHPTHIFSNGVMRPEDRFGAVADMVFAIKQGRIADGLLVLSSDTLFSDFHLRELVEAVTINNGHDTFPVYRENPELMSRRAQVIFNANDDGEIVHFAEKPKKPKRTPYIYASPCIYFYSASTVQNNLPQYASKYSGQLDKLDAPGIFNEALFKSGKRMLAIIMSGQRFDVGNLQGWRETDQFFCEKERVMAR